MLKKIIELEKVNVTYAPEQPSEVRALKDIDMEVYEGEYINIFGPSGCGKSTLLHVIAGLQVPDSGKVNITGFDLPNLDFDSLSRFHCDKIGIIFQVYNLISTLSVLDNVTLPQMFLSESVSKREKKAKRLLKRFGILEQAGKLPTELSGGQMQRVGVARALINNPAILLADEPIGNLDSVSAKKVMEILLKLNREEGQTLILVTHNPEYLTDAHRVLYMKDSRIVKEQINYKLEEPRRPLKVKGGKKREELGRAEATEYDLLARVFSALSPAHVHQLLIPYKAKVLANYLLSPYAGETRIDRLERTINKLFSKEIDFRKFTHVLDLPFEENGVQLNLQRARRFSKEIKDIMTTASFLSQKRGRLDSEKTRELIADFLLRSHRPKLFEAKVERLKLLIGERLENKIDMEGFQELIDRPFIEGGAGLNKQTAEKFARRLELVLLVKYGL